MRAARVPMLPEVEGEENGKPQVLLVDVRSELVPLRLDLDLVRAQRGP
jgi:heme O synthase-like polyprenyltransferase